MAIANVDFSADLEGGVNDQINVEYSAYYIYTSMANYFDRDSVGLKGFSAYFTKKVRACIRISPHGRAGRN